MNSNRPPLQRPKLIALAAVAVALAAAVILAGCGDAGRGSAGAGGAAAGVPAAPVLVPLTNMVPIRAGSFMRVKFPVTLIALARIETSSAVKVPVLPGITP